MGIALNVSQLMSTLLAIMTYPGGNETMLRHWPYFLRQSADWIYVIATEGDLSQAPQGTHKRSIGRDSYISGSHLPTRTLDTITELLTLPWDILLLTEYDVVICNRIRVEAAEHAIAAHYAGGPTWGSKARGFYHNPWMFHREAAIKFVEYGREAIKEGVCGERSGSSYAAPEGSPDVFFGLITGEHNMPVQTNLWTEYSRNSLDQPGHLEEARQAYRNGVDVLHGLKYQRELDYIVS